MSSALRYAVANKASATELTPMALGQMMSDIQDAYDGPFAAAWGVLPAAVVLGNPNSPDSRIFELVDTIPEAPDALAYHTVDAQGRPTMRLGVETIRRNLAEGQALLGAISSALSHEIFECAIDPPCSLFSSVGGKTLLLAYEVCDPVQDGTWKLDGSTTEISNFVLPAYFDGEDKDGPWDYMKVLSGPFGCTAGGYQAWSDGTQTFGENVSTFKRAQVLRFGRLSERLRADTK